MPLLVLFLMGAILKFACPDKFHNFNLDLAGTIVLVALLVLMIITIINKD